MNTNFYVLLLANTLFALGCATTPMPMPTIPQQGNEAVGSFSAGTNGLNLNLGYVTKKKMVFNLSLQTQFLSARSNIYDIGLGAISNQNRLLAMITFGYGRHDVYPISMGSYQAVNRTLVDAFRISAYLNYRVVRNVFFVTRFSHYWGDGEHFRNGSIYYPHYGSREKFQSFAFEPALFYQFGKSKHMLFGMGGHLVKEAMELQTDKYFNPWPLWLGFGYQFGKKF